MLRKIGEPFGAVKNSQYEPSERDRRLTCPDANSTGVGGEYDMDLGLGERVMSARGAPHVHDGEEGLVCPSCQQTIVTLREREGQVRALQTTVQKIGTY